MDQGQRTGESGESERGRGMAWWFIWVFVAMLLYVLSTGPVLKIDRKALMTNRGLYLFYKPLTLACERSRPVRGFFKWYLIDIWRV